MNFLFFWLLTIILSYGFYIDLFYRIIKDFANRGYIFDLNNCQNMNTTMVNEKKTGKISHLIPVLNIMSVFNLGQQYLQNKEMFFHQFKGLLLLSPMTDSELQQYKEKTSVACILNIMNERKIIEEQKKQIIEKLENLKQQENNDIEISKEQSNKATNTKTNIYNDFNNLEEDTTLIEKPKVKTLIKK